MLNYQRVGELRREGAGEELVLADGRPLSYLRVRAEATQTVGLTRALLERRATEFRVRIPLRIHSPEEALQVEAALERFGASLVFPLLEGGEGIGLAWLDWVQMRAVGEALGAGFEEKAGPVDLAGLRIAPTYASAAGSGMPMRDWQYWNSRWEFAARPPDRDRLWRVRPNESRDRRRFARLRSGRHDFGPQARGTFAACLHPEMRAKLGQPRYLVVKHPFRDGWLPILVLEDSFEDREGNEADRDVWDTTIFLDRTARDALGIADGEFCQVYPWLRPRHSVRYRELRDRLVGARMVAAHVRVPARADLEKPVCRLEPSALEAIGGRPGEFVVLERVCPPAGEEPSDRWREVHLSQRVLPISAAERAERKRWSLPQAWDDDSMPSAEGREAPQLEGYVDCGERLGVHPPYPAIYLNYYTRKRGLEGLGLCHPVLVRVGVPSRLMTEASEFVWLVVIGLLGATIAFVPSTALRIVAAAALAISTVCLLVFRAIRAIR